MNAKAVYRYARVAPRKVRLVTDLVRGMPVSRALDVLQFARKSAALTVSKLINSAVANARRDSSVDVDALVVSEIFVDQGPMLKRFLPRAMGRATKIQKKTSHITVVVSDGK
jgi:large subunit ribosomal protein L22